MLTGILVTAWGIIAFVVGVVWGFKVGVRHTSAEMIQLVKDEADKDAALEELIKKL